MVRALGYSNSRFDPSRPGRLCRGRELWVDGWEDSPGELDRLVISGAAFSDDSARDAKRGLVWSGVDLGVLLKALFPGAHLLAFREQAHLAEVPPYVDDEDQFWASRQGGRRLDPRQRWRAFVSEPEELARLVAGDLVDGFVVLDDEELDPELDELLFLLTSWGDVSEYPISRFQPLALRAIAERSKGIVLLHQDKHGAAFGVYSTARVEKADVIGALATGVDALSVPFSIPPMLARWDRALHEFRVRWMAERPDDEFPVPPAEEGASPWSATAMRAREERRKAREAARAAEE